MIWKTNSVLMMSLLISTAARAGYTLQPNCLTGTDDQKRIDRFAADFAEARRLAQSGQDYFNTKDAPPAVYVKWFGAVDAPDGPMGNQAAGTVHLDVENHVRSLWRSMYGWEFSFNCSDAAGGCSGLAAYVLNNDLDAYEPMVVHLCGDNFWGSASTGYEGSVNTILHEVSHFRRNQSHDDEGASLNDGDQDEQSVKEIQQLAKTNPAGLQKNAYAHASFLSDDPASAPVGGCSVTGASRARHLQIGYLLLATLAILSGRRRLMRNKMIKQVGITVGLGMLTVGADSCVRPARANLSRPHQESGSEWMLRQQQKQPVDERLACTFSMPPSAKLGDPLPLTMSLQNRSAIPLRILRHYTPFTTMNNHEYFYVACNGKEQVGLGAAGMDSPRVNHSPPEAYERIEPGATYTVVLPFEKWTHFAPGRCEVKWFNMMAGFGDVIDDMRIDARPRAAWQHRGVVCNGVTVEILP